MKTLRLILAAVALLMAMNVVSAQENNRRNEEQVVFSVSMDCHNCEQKIRRNIPFERGVRNMTTNLEKQMVTINFQTNRTNKDNLKKAIEKLGFTCEEIKPEEEK